MKAVNPYLNFAGNTEQAGGQVTMPLAETEWAERYGMCTDRFGIQWMFNYTGDKEFRP